MKKSSLKRTVLVGVLTIALLFVFVACSGEGENVNTNNEQDTNNEQQVSTVVSIPEQTPSETEERIELTMSNINDYLIFNTTVSDVEIKSAGYANYKMGNCKITVKTSPKKSVEFQDVVLTFTLETKSSGWGTSQGCSLEMPFDGKAETTYSLGSPIVEYKSSSPSYKVVVTDVQGYAIKK